MAPGFQFGAQMRSAVTDLSGRSGHAGMMDGSAPGVLDREVCDMDKTKQCILIVDDHTILLASMRTLLEIEGFKVATATDGVKALELMDEVRPDLVISDIMMPEMDGSAFRSAVRARPEWARIPFIFLTALTERIGPIDGSRIGIDGYITKPFYPGDMLAMIRDMLAQVTPMVEPHMAAITLRPTEIDIDKLLEYITSGAGPSPPALDSIRLSGHPTNWDFSLLRHDQLQALELAAS